MNARTGVKKGIVDHKHLISASTDLLPRFCDYADVATSIGRHGRSVREMQMGYRGLIGYDKGFW